MIQCQGNYSSFDARSIWKAATEGKHKFFAWLAIQSRVLTADKLLKRNWNCNPFCPLCDQENETVDHLILQCIFSKQVWQYVNDWKLTQVYSIPESNKTLKEWWNDAMARCQVKERKSSAAIIMDIAWNIWKERNRRLFQQQALQPSQVLSLIKEEINAREMAYGHQREQ